MYSRKMGGIKMLTGYYSTFRDTECLDYLQFATDPCQKNNSVSNSSSHTNSLLKGKEWRSRNALHSSGDMSRLSDT